MFLGQREVRFNVYTDKSIQSGWRYAMRNVYRCERCGREAEVVGEPREPFYCHGNIGGRACNHLIGIEPAEATACNCWVRETSPESQFSIRRGAHSKTCPAYRESLDPVDRQYDNDLRRHGEHGRIDVHCRRSRELDRLHS